MRARSRAPAWRCGHAGQPDVRERTGCRARCASRGRRDERAVSATPPSIGRLGVRPHAGGDSRAAPAGPRTASADPAPASRCTLQRTSWSPKRSTLPTGQAALILTYALHPGSRGDRGTRTRPRSASRCVPASRRSARRARNRGLPHRAGRREQPDLDREHGRVGNVHHGQDVVVTDHVQARHREPGAAERIGRHAAQRARAAQVELRLRHGLAAQASVHRPAARTRRGARPGGRPPGLSAGADSRSRCRSRRRTTRSRAARGTACPGSARASRCRVSLARPRVTARLKGFTSGS